jgi:hypothetical protein
MGLKRISAVRRLTLLTAGCALLMLAACAPRKPAPAATPADYGALGRIESNRRRRRVPAAA